MIASQGWPRHRCAAGAVRFALALSAVSSVVLWSAPSRAQSAADSATAQALFERAKRLMEDGRYADACPLFEESERIESRSGTQLNLADCYEKAGRLASAWSMYLNAAALAKGNNPERETVARDRAAALVPKLSNLVITAPSNAPAGLEIIRDGVKVGQAQLGVLLPADGGTHTVEASAPGKKPWRSMVTLRASGQTLKIEVPNLEDASAAPEKAPGDEAATREGQPGAARASRFTPAVVTGLVVTGALGVGTVVTGVLYGVKNEDYDEANRRGYAARAEMRKEVQTIGVVNLALLGGTVLAAGVTVFLLARGPSPNAGTSAQVQLGGVVAPGLAMVSIEGRL